MLCQPQMLYGGKPCERVQVAVDTDTAPSCKYLHVLGIVPL